MSTIYVPVTVARAGIIGMTVGARSTALAMAVRARDKPAVPMTVIGPWTVGLTVGTQAKTFTFEIDAKTVVVAPGGQYPGPYTVTPTRSTQTLPTYGLTMGGNVIVNPIPPEYGLVTWNGYVLTVS